MSRQDAERKLALSTLADLLERAKAGKIGPADINWLYEMERRLCGN